MWILAASVLFPRSEINAVDWATVDWPALAALRATFLAAAPGGTGTKDYWTSDSLLRSYDGTFAARIGWKWDAVLQGVTLPEGATLYDWGCGTGIATRRVLAACGAHVAACKMFDRSARAQTYALASLGERTKGSWDPRAGFAKGSPAVLLVSHVLTELPRAAEDELMALARAADAVVWVEPGTLAASAALVRVREGLRESLSVVAPCPHQGRCGMLDAANAQNWCHAFARPPAEAHQSAGWRMFADKLGIDLRSLPVAYVVLMKGGEAQARARVIGRSREYKGYAKYLRCDGAGVREATLNKRDDKDLFKRLGKEEWFVEVP